MDTTPLIGIRHQISRKNFHVTPPPTPAHSRITIEINILNKKLKYECGNTVTFIQDVNKALKCNKCSTKTMVKQHRGIIDVG